MELCHIFVFASVLELLMPSLLTRTTQTPTLHTNTPQGTYEVSTKHNRTDDDNL